MDRRLTVLAAVCVVALAGACGTASHSSVAGPSSTVDGGTSIPTTTGKNLDSIDPCTLFSVEQATATLGEPARQATTTDRGTCHYNTVGGQAISAQIGVQVSIKPEVDAQKAFDVNVTPDLPYIHLISGLDRPAFGSFAASNGSGDVTVVADRTHLLTVIVRSRVNRTSVADDRAKAVEVMRSILSHLSS